MIEKLSLLELQQAVREILSANFEEKYWVVAQVSQISDNKAGHCYLELIENDANGKTIAKVRATIWSFIYKPLRSYFELMVGEKLKAGMKILVLAAVEYHEIYGFSLNINDIDPTYTLGDQERKRQEIIEQLQEDGIFDMNKELSLSIVPQRVAIISSETAAGYGDFINQLKNNSFGYVFYTKLFQATLQGVNAEVSIISAFDSIFEHSPFFDAVVLIRGGGSKEELSVFDSYLIASNIAQYPIPVLTGIGHDRDESIADLVAYKKLKTPTAVAEFLIERVSVFDTKMQNIFVKINSNLENVFSIQKSNLQSFTNILQPLIKNFIFLKKNTLSQAENDVKEFMNQTFTTQKIHLQSFENKLSNASRNLMSKKNNYLLKKSLILKNSYKLRLIYEQNRMNQISKIFTKDLHFYLKQEHLRLENDSKWLNNLSPEKILQRGYAIVYKGNTILKSVEEAKKGNLLEIKLKDGKILSEVK